MHWRGQGPGVPACHGLNEHLRHPHQIMNSSQLQLQPNLGH
ncbi:MAG: hypothetical protein EBR69_04465 [Synechococcaceae bacterium WB4_2_0805]|nr:hypothetical protein [Synechococcaceae bacterium WB4_2_0805]